MFLLWNLRPIAILAVQLKVNQHLGMFPGDLCFEWLTFIDIYYILHKKVKLKAPIKFSIFVR